MKGSVGWVDFDRVDNIDHIEELQECFVSEIPTNVDFLTAKKKELDFWLGLGVYEPVSDCGQKTIDTRQHWWQEDFWRKISRNMIKNRLW